MYTLRDYDLSKDNLTLHLTPGGAAAFTAFYNNKTLVFRYNCLRPIVLLLNRSLLKEEEFCLDIKLTCVSPFSGKLLNG